MLNLVHCELLKLKRSKMVLISILGGLSTPCLMFAEALQNHFRHPERMITLSDIYSNSLMYVMLLTNMVIYVAIIAYLFIREYSEHTLKTILPIPISRTRLLIVKFFTLFLWIIMLTGVTWIGIFILSGIYHIAFHLEGYCLFTASVWLLKFLFGGVLMFATVSPFAYIAQKTKGFVVPIIIASVIVMGSAALSNQDMGALYPWTATFFIVNERIQNTGYPMFLSIGLITFVSVMGFLLTFFHFKKEDLK